MKLCRVMHCLPKYCTAAVYICFICLFSISLWMTVHVCNFVYIDGLAPRLIVSLYMTRLVLVVCVCRERFHFQSNTHCDSSTPNEQLICQCCSLTRHRTNNGEATDFKEYSTHLHCYDWRILWHSLPSSSLIYFYVSWCLTKFPRMLFLTLRQPASSLSPSAID